MLNDSIEIKQKQIVLDLPRNGRLSFHIETMEKRIGEGRVHKAVLWTNE